MFFWSKAQEIADKMSVNDQKHLNNNLVSNDGTCKQERVPELETYLGLNKGLSVSAGLPQLTAWVKKLRIPAMCSTSILILQLFIIKVRILVS